MFVSFPRKDERKARINPHEVISDCDGTGTNPTFMKFVGFCQISTGKANTTTPTLGYLLIEKAKDPFGQQVAGTASTPSSSYANDPQSTLAHTTLIGSEIQAVVPNSLLPCVLYLA